MTVNRLVTSWWLRVGLGNAAFPAGPDTFFNILAGPGYAATRRLTA